MDNWHRRVWSLAAPLILSNLSVPLLGAVDTAVVGRLPDPAYIGGVAIGSLIFGYIYWGFAFLRMGTTGLTAQAMGASDANETRAVFARAFVVAAILAVALLTLQVPIQRLAFWALRASDEVERHARAYYAIRIWGAPAALANFGVIGWLFGVGRTRDTLVIQVAQNGLNIALDLLFVFGFGWGIQGVAAATVISEFAGFGVGMGLVARAFRRVGGEWNRRAILDRKRLGQLVRINRDIMIRTLCLQTGFAYFTQRGAILGDVTLAANAILMQFQAIQAFGLDAFAYAAEILIGNAIGARSVKAFRSAVRVSTQWAFGVACLFALAYLVGGSAIIRAMTTLPEVIRASESVLYWAVLSPIVSVWSFQLDGVYLGATRTRDMRNAMLLSLALFLAAERVFLPVWGNHGLWFSLMVFMLARAGTLGFRYPRIARSVERPVGA